MRKVLLAAAALAAVGLGDGSARAAATLHIGTGSGTSCGAGGCYAYPTLNPKEVNGNTTSMFDVYQNSGGAQSLGSVMLFFATPNNPASALSGNPVISSSLAGSPGVTVSSGVFKSYGEMTAGGDVYATAGLTPSGGSSDSFTNLSGADLDVLGITASNFSIYSVTLTLSGGMFGGKDALDFTVDGLPLGTFIVAYGAGTTKDYSTPFTESGLSEVPSVPTPEPASIALLGFGLLGLGLTHRYRKG